MHYRSFYHFNPYCFQYAVITSRDYLAECSFGGLKAVLLFFERWINILK